MLTKTTKPRRMVHLVRRPEPTIDQFWEELGFVATVKVAFPGDNHYHHGEMDGKDGDHVGDAVKDDDNQNRPSRSPEELGVS